ncbi:MAG: transmembrane 220 family protein [Pseudomonadota bacterium]
MQFQPLTMGHRITAGFFTLLMLTMAYLQLNDPDPALWVAVYLTLAGLTLLGSVLGRQKLVAGAALAVAVVWAATLAPSAYELFANHPAGDLLTGMSPDRPYVEEAREAGGLLIGALAMLHLVLARKRPTDELNQAPFHAQVG